MDLNIQLIQVSKTYFVCIYKTMDLAKKFHNKYVKDKMSFVPKPQNQQNTNASSYTDSNVSYYRRKL